jgi:hypothetical protein
MLLNSFLNTIVAFGTNLGSAAGLYLTLSICLKAVLEYTASLLLSGLIFILTCYVNSLRFFSGVGGEPAIITNSLCLEEENDYKQILKEAKKEFEDLKDNYFLE